MSIWNQKFFSEMGIFKHFITETNKKALWSILQKWVGMQAHACHHRSPRAKFWYAVFQKYMVPPQLRVAHFLLNTINWSSLISRTIFKTVAWHDPLYAGTWRQGSGGSYAIGEHCSCIIQIFFCLLQNFLSSANERVVKRRWRRSWPFPVL